MNLQTPKNIQKSMVVAVAVALLGSSSSLVHAGPFEKLMTGVDGFSEVRFSNADLLKNSQISYRAEGGFTSVQSYGVILSCVNGKISVLKTIMDPRLSEQASAVHDVSTITPDQYLDLWDNLDRQAVFRMKDAPEPTHDIADEFSVTFHAKVGDVHNEFHVTGISRPIAARYFALRELIDGTVHMKALWSVHSNVARLDQDLIP